MDVALIHAKYCAGTGIFGSAVDTYSPDQTPHGMELGQCLPRNTPRIPQLSSLLGPIVHDFLASAELPSADNRELIISWLHIANEIAAGAARGAHNRDQACRLLLQAIQRMPTPTPAAQHPQLATVLLLRQLLLVRIPNTWPA